ncbi:hypothetical protein Srot_2031 [Segniliparus rotundus DSM 44985]|uniref:Excalibur calcium-binding domain-containing protein n=1 Tax=Segniliparus rotundus (strain ATCC BAA-972 / CDC 1076 / CIP 108378 / DSM 44985 / JCM 13578) TaxID=640132 RepID=D6Z957_SEGRD|nr:excalibur calcium-binding domain-containing protein [Segniliparus rotundus]ADG98487.1 hypothetical protein Srot_2031 [Segniliparus rotundus DSM 44985]
MRKTAWVAYLLGVAGALCIPTASLASADDSDPQPSAEAASGQTQKSPAVGGTVWVRGPFGDLLPLNGWRNCNEAKMAGHFPVTRGELGYNPELDPENTGLECT